MKTRVLKILRKMDKLQQQILILTVCENLTFDETAKVLNIKKTIVKNIYRTAMRKVKTDFNKNKKES